MVCWRYSVRTDTAFNARAAGWFQWSLRLNTTQSGNNAWNFAACYQLGYLKYANLYGVPS